MQPCRILTACLLIGLCAPLSAGDVDDLKAAFDNALESLSQRDLDGFLSAWHPEAVLFARNQVHPIDRAKMDEKVWVQGFENFFARIISAGYRMRAVEFRVVGETGIVWGLTRFGVDPRYEASFDQDTRLTAVFVKSDGAWKILHWNDAPWPEGRAPLGQ